MAHSSCGASAHASQGEAACSMFCAHDFGATTVDQIAEAVEVSPRTYFRYFASKEDIALSLADEQIARVLEGFAAHPADLPVLTATRRAAVARLIGVRMGVDLAADPRPYLVASLTLCAVPAEVNTWRAAGRDAPGSELIG
ncbi:TetR/AcrR family transcriptional regulator [Nonomuraea sp. GTA35]|uniref:TetR/AcrR family transcriptional regulator n=1 Tax=Nonomuraea sp. GTA35 TaxID=1676746 RepID=UPI0035BEE85D